MVYPAQTSLMPIHVALARFLTQDGGVLAKYPYWYLGTTPIRYLTGPILPAALIILQRFSSLNMFEIFLCLVSFSFPLGASGVYLLVRDLKGSRLSAFLTAVFYFFGPIIPFLFRFSSGLYLITFTFLPFILVGYLRFLRKRTQKLFVLLLLMVSFVILLDSMIVPSLIIGMVAIFIAKVGWRKTEERLRQSLWLIFGSFLLTTLWYTPGYWLTLLGAPSLAGKGLAGVIAWLLKLLPTALAFGVAIFSGKFFKKRNLLRDFCFYWLFIFGFLTLFRFLSDPDFWLDWIAYGIELQFGLAILGGLLLGRWLKRVEKKPVHRAWRYQVLMSRRTVTLVLVLVIVGTAWMITFNSYVVATLQPNVEETVEYKLGKYLSEIAKPGDRVFLSGTSTFWLNAFFDIPQVRGGVDQASTDPNWRKATWELREGTNPEKSVKWLKDLDVSYLVVHTDESKEFYHDFTYQEKFEKAEGLEKIYDESGDRIYRVAY